MGSTSIGGYERPRHGSIDAFDKPYPLKKMAYYYLAWDLLLLEERVKIYGRRVEMRMLRDSQNPFSLPLNEFVRNFRLTPDMALFIVRELRDRLMRKRSIGLSPELQVLVTISFYANGSYQRPIGNNFCTNISQSSVSRCIKVVTQSINDILLATFIKFPVSPQSRDLARREFSEKYNFEGAIGAIDCTFINIVAPNINEHAYVNHHGRHSLNVQAIVGPCMKFLNVNARFPGARNDAFIWKNSCARAVMQKKFLEGERNTWIIGDAGYPLEPWLMTPLPNYEEGTRQHAYTQKLCRARCIVERAFGCLKSTWRCCSEQRILMYSPELAGKIVNACAVLFNLRILSNLPPEEFYDPAEAGVSEVSWETCQEPHLVLARRIQNRLMAKQFPHLVDAN